MRYQNEQKLRTILFHVLLDSVTIHPLHVDFGFSEDEPLDFLLTLLCGALGIIWPGSSLTIAVSLQRS